MKRVTTILVGLISLSALAWLESKPEFQKNWPAWRGPLATGVALFGDPPTKWSENENVRWKIAIPGKGNSSPIVWGSTIFITTAVEADSSEKTLRFEILAINRRDGRIIWQKTCRKEVPHEGTHHDGSFASNSPVTDGEHVFAYFGSRGLYCFDMQGKLKWEKDLGDMNVKRGFGEGSSPVLHRNTIVVNWDHEGDSFIVGFDKRTGKEIWKTSRDEGTSWSTPLIVEHEDKPQVVVSATNRTRSYDLASGKLLWECSGMTANTIPSPVATDGVVYVTSGFRGSSMQASHLAQAHGDISGSAAIVWALDRDTPYVPSPLLYENAIYFLKTNSGILTCVNAKTGETHYGPQRLEGISNIYASPVGVNGRIYLVGRDGTVLIIKHGPQFEVLAQNSLDDGFDASPAIVDRELYLRGRKYLYCIAEE